MNNPEIIKKRKANLEKDRQIKDLELLLADQTAKNIELEKRQQDTELALADILIGGSK